MGNTGTQRILLAGGNPIVRSAVKRVLERKGYSLWEAATFDEALASSSRGDFDLLLIHAESSWGDSQKLLGEARKARPTLPALFLEPASPPGLVCRWPPRREAIYTARQELPFAPDRLCQLVEDLILQSTQLLAPGAE